MARGVENIGEKTKVAYVARGMENIGEKTKVGRGWIIEGLIMHGDTLF